MLAQSKISNTEAPCSESPWAFYTVISQQSWIYNQSFQLSPVTVNEGTAEVTESVDGSCC